LSLLNIFWAAFPAIHCNLFSDGYTLKSENRIFVSIRAARCSTLSVSTSLIKSFASLKSLGYKVKILNCSMGLVYADIELINGGDVEMARRHIIGEEEIKRQTVNMLVDNGYQQQFTYWPSYDRVKSELLYNGILQNTRLYFGDFEIQKSASGIVTNIHYVQGGEGLCAIIKVDAANTITEHFVYNDHLGSITTITDASGTVIVNQSFDAWGRTRNPFDWTYSTTTLPASPLWLYRGYTGHEAMPEFALINMNARLYDPVVGKMISPDNLVWSASHSQAYNRYSYARNNPMVYIDPDGNFAQAAFFASAFLGEFTSNLIYGNSNAFGRAIKSASSSTNEIANLFTVPVTENFSVGINPFSLGIAANLRFKSGNSTFGISVGAGFGGGYLGGGYTFDDGTTSFGASAGIGTSGNYSFGGFYKYKGWGGGYTWNHYEQSGNLGAQNTGTASLYFNNNSFNLENDFLRGGGHDRWRTQSATLQFGQIGIGAHINNNSPPGAKDDGLGRKSYLGFLNKHAKSTHCVGETYESPLYFSYAANGYNSRIGINHPIFQELTQNLLIHRILVPTAMFVDYNYFKQDVYFGGIFGYQYLGQWGK
jgi:RHS repeat-associated protein